MKNKKIIAVKTIANDAAIAITDIVYGIDDVIYIAHIYGDKIRHCKRPCKIRYNASGDPYFVHYGYREYLRDFMQV